MDLKTIGVVGCGLMGSGIVEILAKNNYDVIVREVSDEFLQKGLARLDASLQKGVSRNKLTAEQKEAALSRVRGTVALEDLAPCDYVIEAAIEKLDLKKDIFARLDAITRPEVILATNSSSLSIAAIAAMTRRPDKVLGMHFFNPVPVMELLEIVRSFMTSDETLATSRALGEALGKKIIVAKDYPGFIVNALFIPYQLDAIRFYQNGMASREDIDLGMHLGMNHPMGPLTLADFVGLDTILFVADEMYAETKDPRYAAPPLLRRMVAAGHLGKKSGKGFYDYSK
ncbi:MAG: 3-hydroxyacyl-CoA dehydrogenase NAD-binding domain-containing protein [Anaerolineales bacterium]|nr:3-hydroxyacyl-CoA dehydrogenase NAD-binding domain-containing protein [Anaerolineales bacterium]